MVAAPVDYETELARMRADWRQIAPGPVPAWRSQLSRMRTDVDELRTRGLWRSGRRSLLGAMGIHDNEVLTCRGLAWLLDPDGWHGLGSSVLDGLLSRLGVDTLGTAHVRSS